MEGLYVFHEAMLHLMLLASVSRVAGKNWGHVLPYTVGECQQGGMQKLGPCFNL